MNSRWLVNICRNDSTVEEQVAITQTPILEFQRTEYWPYAQLPADVVARYSLGVTSGGYSDGMVLQQRERCPIWGWGPAGATMTVSFRGQRITGVADRDGAWRVDVGAGEAGGPFVLVVEGSSRVETKDVHVGEVWLVSGQSNAGQVAAFTAPDSDPHGVRFYTTGRKGWATAGDVAMVAWHFGRELRKRHHVPVGIIVSAVGGTCIEQWKPGADAGLAQAGPGEITGDAAGLYDTLVVPLQPYRIQGVAWWQGESNARNAGEYLGKFIALIEAWRQAWGQPYPRLPAETDSHGRSRAVSTGLRGHALLHSEPLSAHTPGGPDGNSEARMNMQQERWLTEGCPLE
jgi:hypothetical protein